MAIFNNFDYKYEYDSDGVPHLKMIRIGLTPSKQFFKDLKFSKATVPFRCRTCEKDRPKNTRYLCSNYDKICIKCAELWIKNSIKTMGEAKEELNITLKNFNDNKADWERDMVIGALS